MKRTRKAKHGIDPAHNLFTQQDAYKHEYTLVLHPVKFPRVCVLYQRWHAYCTPNPLRTHRRNGRESADQKGRPRYCPPQLSKGSNAHRNSPTDLAFRCFCAGSVIALPCALLCNIVFPKGKQCNARNARSRVRGGVSLPTCEGLSWPGGFLGSLVDGLKHRAGSCAEGHCLPWLFGGGLYSGSR